MTNFSAIHHPATSYLFFILIQTLKQCNIKFCLNDWWVVSLLEITRKQEKKFLGNKYLIPRWFPTFAKLQRKAHYGRFILHLKRKSFDDNFRKKGYIKIGLHVIERITKPEFWDPHISYVPRYLLKGSWL